MRKGTGFTISEIRSYRNISAVVIEGPPTEDRKIFGIMAVSVYILGRSPRKAICIRSALFLHPPRVGEEVVHWDRLMNGWNLVPSQTHRHLLARRVSPHEEYLQF